MNVISAIITIGGVAIEQVVFVAIGVMTVILSVVALVQGMQRGYEREQRHGPRAVFLALGILGVGFLLVFIGLITPPAFWGRLHDR